MEFTYLLSAGIALLIMGISFLRNRISHIKKGSRTLATIVKLEEHTDTENNKYYIPYFTFTTHTNKEITYKPKRFDGVYGWKLGEKVKVMYKESDRDNYDVLVLTFTSAFSLTAIILTVSFMLFVAAAAIFWNASNKLCFFIPVSIILPGLVIKLWSNRFFNTLHQTT